MLTVFDEAEVVGPNDRAGVDDDVVADFGVVRSSSRLIGEDRFSYCDALRLGAGHKTVLRASCIFRLFAGTLDLDRNERLMVNAPACPWHSSGSIRRQT